MRNDRLQLATNCDPSTYSSTTKLEKSFYEQISNIQNINQLFSLGGAAALAVNAVLLCAMLVRHMGALYVGAAAHGGAGHTLIQF